MRCAAQGRSLFVPLTVVLELECVLRAVVGYRKPQTLHVLSDLPSAAELRFESQQAVEVALHLFRHGSADWADCLHVALAAQVDESPLGAFDRRAAGLAGTGRLDG